MHRLCGKLTRISWSLCLRDIELQTPTSKISKKFMRKCGSHHRWNFCKIVVVESVSCALSFVRFIFVCVHRFENTERLSFSIMKKEGSACSTRHGHWSKTKF